MNRTIIFICSTSSISALLAAPRIPDLDKLLQHDGEEDAGTKRRSKNCGKIQTYSNELVFFYSDNFIIRNKSDCIQKSEDIDSFGETESRMRINSKSDAASSSQVRLQDAYLGGLMDTAAVKPVASEEESGDMDLSESETGSLHEEEVTGRPVACNTAKGKPYASSKPDHPRSPKVERIEWSHCLYMSPATVHHMEAVFSIVRKIYACENMTTRWMIWT